MKQLELFKIERPVHRLRNGRYATKTWLIQISKKWEIDTYGWKLKSTNECI